MNLLFLCIMANYVNFFGGKNVLRVFLFLCSSSVGILRYTLIDVVFVSQKVVSRFE